MTQLKKILNISVKRSVNNMIIIGDEKIPYNKIEKISNINDIKNSKPNSTLLFEYNIKLIQYCHKNDLNCAVIIKNINQLLYSASYNTKYAISTHNLAKKIQKIVENYMYDIKILSIIKSSNDLEKIALDEIDGCIYDKLLKI
jgi:hypothetical protein